MTNADACLHKGLLHGLLSIEMLNNIHNIVNGAPVEDFGVTCLSNAIRQNLRNGISFGRMIFFIQYRLSEPLINSYDAPCETPY